MEETAPQSNKRRRRRGASLEAAILEAAWEELVAVGYPVLTMEAVATRAHASKPVLYRRWSNRPELVLAAVRHHAKIASTEVPDTGSLRGDVLALLREVSERSAELAGLYQLSARRVLPRNRPAALRATRAHVGWRQRPHGRDSAASSRAW